MKTLLKLILVCWSSVVMAQVTDQQLIDYANVRIGTLEQERQMWQKAIDLARAAAATPTPTPTPTPEPAPAPTPIAEVPAPLANMGYRLVKNWDFTPTGNIRTLAALAVEFNPTYTAMGVPRFGANNEWQRFQPFNTRNYVFTTEGLALTANLAPGAVFPPNDDTLGIHSGGLESKWSGQYGYFEALVKVPNVRGAWPQFWLIPVNHVQRYPEIDIMEIVVGTGGNGGTQHSRRSFHHLHPMSAPHQLPPTYRHPNTIVGSTWREYWPGGINSTSFDYSQGFHKFAVIWEPGRIRHYVDDVLVFDTPFISATMGANTTIGADSGPLFVILNYTLGGSWPGVPVPASLPSSFVVKSMKVWQK